MFLLLVSVKTHNKESERLYTNWFGPKYTMPHQVLVVCQIIHCLSISMADTKATVSSLLLLSFSIFMILRCALCPFWAWFHLCQTVLKVSCSVLIDLCIGLIDSRDVLSVEMSSLMLILSLVSFDTSRFMETVAVSSGEFHCFPMLLPAATVASLPTILVAELVAGADWTCFCFRPFITFYEIKFTTSIIFLFVQVNFSSSIIYTVGQERFSAYQSLMAEPEIQNQKFLLKCGYCHQENRCDKASSCKVETLENEVACKLWNWYVHVWKRQTAGRSLINSLCFEVHHKGVFAG